MQWYEGECEAEWVVREVFVRFVVCGVAACGGLGIYCRGGVLVTVT